MATHAPASDPPLLAVEALDEFVAEIVRQAHARGLHVPSRFFDWATGDGTRLVERLVRRRAVPPGGAPQELLTALRCGVRYWVAPWVVARFPELRELFPELAVRSGGEVLTVLVRTGRWRCASGSGCLWKFCEAG
ncbi:hypothetical protein FN976_16105 [Caenimonas sedimenti]|uniref:Uncharacterized protein n=1 Tax=Caenimonas sedimenti TaxID=2596921 RepID=A0A562ZPI9_9BURK|nr:hypothetical protein [Caenimonas sedimenti]TWO70499.1 hypothetical protein FN976_16105 [Caenimonas sedimenti]